MNKSLYLFGGKIDGTTGFFYLAPYAGVYPSGPYDQYFDASSVPELTSFVADAQDFIVGAGVAIADFADMLEAQAEADPVAFGYGLQVSPKFIAS